MSSSLPSLTPSLPLTSLSSPSSSLYHLCLFHAPVAVALGCPTPSLRVPWVLPPRRVAGSGAKAAGPAVPVLLLGRCRQAAKSKQPPQSPQQLPEAGGTFPGGTRLPMESPAGRSHVSHGGLAMQEGRKGAEQPWAARLWSLLLNPGLTRDVHQESLCRKNSPFLLLVFFRGQL